MDIRICRHCQSEVVKSGTDKDGVQVYRCKTCNKRSIKPFFRAETEAERVNRHILESRESQPEESDEALFTEDEVPQDEITGPVAEEEEETAETEPEPESEPEPEPVQEIAQEEEEPSPTINDAMLAVQGIAQRILQQGQQVEELIKQKEVSTLTSKQEAEKLLKPHEQTGGIHEDGVYFNSGKRVSPIDFHFCRLWSLREGGIQEDSEEYIKEQQDYNAVINEIKPIMKYEGDILEVPVVTPVVKSKLDRILRR